MSNHNQDDDFKHDDSPVPSQPFRLGILFPMVKSPLMWEHVTGMEHMSERIGNNWLVVEPTHLKDTSQIGSFPQTGMNMKNIWVATT